MGNIPSKPVVVNQEWTNGVTKLNQTNLTSGVNQNITNIKTAVDGIIDALGGPGADPENFEEITWTNLKALRDAGKLVPGKQYRITDYVTAVEQPECRSAGHPFDIIVTALTPNTLSEDAKAIERDGDTYFVRPIAVSATWKSGITISDIETLYKMTDGDGNYNTPVERERTFTQMGTMVDPDTGVEVPYLFEPDPEGEGEPSGHDRRYLFAGEYEFDGVIYDEWKECYVDGTPIITGGGCLYYELTNVVVDCEQGFLKKATLAAWKLKYCLDNDYARFGFAVRHDVIQVRSENGTYLYLRYPSLDGNNGLAWVYLNNGEDVEIEDNFDYDDISTDDIIYTPFSSVNVGDELDMTGVPVTVTATRIGKGVIYEMEDEWGNKLPYDFKNVQFKRYNVKHDTSSYDGFDNQYVGCKDSQGSLVSPKGYKTLATFKWCYTFNWYGEFRISVDCSMVGNKTLYKDSGGLVSGCCHNVFGVCMEFDLGPDIDTHMNRMYLGNNVIWGSYENDEGFSGGFNYNTIGDGFNYNTMGDGFNDNTIGNDFNSNTVGERFESNIVGNRFYRNTVGDDFTANSVGNDFYTNTVKNEFCYNFVGNEFILNTIGSEFNHNIIGNDFDNNTVGYLFEKNTVGNRFYHNTVVYSFTNNVIGEKFFDNTVREYFDGNTVGNNFNTNTVGNYFQHNNVGNYFYANTVGDYFQFNTVGNILYRNTLGDYIYYSTIKDEVKYVTLDTPSGSYNNHLQYITLGLSIKGESRQNPLVITPTRNANYEQEYVSANKVVRQV